MNVKNKFFFILVALIVGLLTINGAFAETADSMPEKPWPKGLKIA